MSRAGDEAASINESFT